MTFGRCTDQSVGNGVHAQSELSAELSRSSWDEVRKCSSQKARALPQDVAKLLYDADGHITSMTTNDRVTYQYSKFGCDGQPTVCKITDGKTGDWGQWRKESEGVWRSYHKDKPNYEILRGRWTVDTHGKMHMEGQQDTAPLPPVTQPHEAHRSVEHRIGPGPGGLPGSPPAGYETVHKQLPLEAVTMAKHLLGGEYGTETPFEVNGRHFMARVEPHYHPPGFVGGPNGWHKGVTVYEADRIVYRSSNGSQRPVAFSQIPDSRAISNSPAQI
jgi:hypothetical protein